MKRKNIITFSIVLFFIAGLSLMLYPAMSRWWNSKWLSQAVVSYNDALKELDPKEIERLFQEAEEYNETIRNMKDPLINWEKLEGYYETLKIEGTDVMGYIKIPKLELELPFYHGTSDGVLSKAVGHLEGTSLPIGGEGNHGVLSAHCGLPSSELFTDLEQLDVGDEFVVRVLDRALEYEVDQILIVEPDEVNALAFAQGKDYCTLMTCTPYGINSHRLLVRGCRKDTTKIQSEVKKGGER